MVEEYAAKCYAPSHARFGTMMTGDRAAAKELAAWRKRIAGEWHEVRIEGIETLKADHLQVGGSFDIRVKVHLGKTPPGEVDVQACYGRLDAMGEIVEPQIAVAQTIRRGRSRLRNVHRPHGMPGQRAIRACGPGAAEARQSVQSVRAGLGDMGLT